MRDSRVGTSYAAASRSGKRSSNFGGSCVGAGVAENLVTQNSRRAAASMSAKEGCFLWRYQGALDVGEHADAGVAVVVDRVRIDHAGAIVVDVEHAVVVVVVTDVAGAVEIPVILVRVRIARTVVAAVVVIVVVIVIVVVVANVADAVAVEIVLIGVGVDGAIVGRVVDAVGVIIVIAGATDGVAVEIGLVGIGCQRADVDRVAIGVRTAGIVLLLCLISPQSSSPRLSSGWNGAWKSS